MADDGSSITGGGPHEIGTAQVRVDKAVLLDAVSVVLLGTANRDGAGVAVGLELGGRVNHGGGRRASALYLMDAAGAANVVAELVGLASRSGDAGFLDALRDALEALP